MPRDWVEEDLLGAFTAAGFIDFEVVSPGRGSLPCAKLKDDGGLPSLVIQTENHSIDVERAVAKRRMINLDTEKLQFSGRGATAPRRTVNPAPSNAAATGPATNGTNALAGAKAASKGKGNQAGQATTGTNTGAQDPQTTGGGDRARSRSPVRGPSDWYDIGAGQCFFNVVGAHYAVYRDGYTWKDACKLAKSRGAILRSEIASYIREKPDHFKPFWLPPPTPADETEKENLTQMEGGAPPTTWEEYLQALDRPGRWCDDLTFRAMTKRLNCRILLIVGDIAAPDQVIAYGKRISYKDDRRQLGCGSGLIQRWPLPTHCAESWQGTPPRSGLSWRRGVTRDRCPVEAAGCRAGVLLSLLSRGRGHGRLLLHVLPRPGRLRKLVAVMLVGGFLLRLLLLYFAVKAGSCASCYLSAGILGGW